MSDPGSPGAAAARFADLRLRLLSAAALLALGALAIWAGGWAFQLVTLLAATAMTFELARLGDPARPGLAAVIAVATAASIAGAAARPWAPDAFVLLLGPALFLITPRRDRLLAAVWTGLVAMACLGLIEARLAGALPVVWLIGVVVVCDVAGYFAGRLMGGPKFWPTISPKKTWSGTVAGWLAAAVWSVVMLRFIPSDPPWALVATAPVFALAGQMSDIFESWIKRRAGVKDSSSLIPGHGGVMDRFDALTGAAALGMALEWLRQGLGG